MGFRIVFYHLIRRDKLLEAIQYEFMRNAIISGVLVSIGCGIIGSLVVANRIVFISGGIAHAAYGGIGLAFYMGFNPVLGSALFSIGVSMIMGAVSFNNRERSDTLIGVMWALGMALGVILIDLTPGYNADLMSYLFGSILSVPNSDIMVMILLDVAIFIMILMFYKEFLAMSYDEEFSFIVGIPVRLFYFVLLGMIGLSVVMIIRVVGLILVIALLTIPPYIAEKYTRSMAGMMILATILSIAFSLSGLWFSYNYDLTSGATIIMVAGVTFFISLLVDFIRGI